VLAEVAERDLAIDDDAARVGLLLAHQEPEDRRLARAVRAHEADLLTPEHAHRGVEVEDLRAVLLRDLIETYHGDTIFAVSCAQEVSRSAVRSSKAHERPFQSDRAALCLLGEGAVGREPHMV